MKPSRDPHADDGWYLRIQGTRKARLLHYRYGNQMLCGRHQDVIDHEYDKPGLTRHLDYFRPHYPKLGDRKCRPCDDARDAMLQAAKSGTP